MTNFAEMYNRNHEIAEHSKIILYLIEDRSICDTDVSNDLFFGLLEKIKFQMDFEEHYFFKKMLTDSRSEVKVAANNFLSNSAEIKRVLKQYTKRWTHKNHLRIKDHQKFKQESYDVFEMLENYIIKKTEKLYPIVRQIEQDKVT